MKYTFITSYIRRARYNIFYRNEITDFPFQENRILKIKTNKHLSYLKQKWAWPTRRLTSKKKICKNSECTEYKITGFCKPNEWFRIFLFLPYKTRKVMDRDLRNIYVGSLEIIHPYTLYVYIQWLHSRFVLYVFDVPD